MITSSVRNSISWSPLGRSRVAKRLICFLVLVLATLPVMAGDQVPFNGTVSGQIPPDFLTHGVPGQPCLLDFFVSNSGNATVLGPFTGQAEFRPNLCDGSYAGTFHWVAANGDTISGPFFGQLIPTATPGVFDNTETALVTSGTGRFTGASGMFTLGGQVEL